MLKEHQKHTTYVSHHAVKPPEERACQTAKTRQEHSANTNIPRISVGWDPAEIREFVENMAAVGFGLLGLDCWV